MIYTNTLSNCVGGVAGVVSESFTWVRGRLAAGGGTAPGLV
jgi:hypothetical protein